MKHSVVIGVISLIVLNVSLAFADEQGRPVPKIQDNSFLIEEAYNQEPGVVQHISFFQWDPESETWDYNFTQEWPLGTQDHQFSYTLPVSKVTDSEYETGLGDILINYRYQVVARDNIAFAPRFSLILPTGDVDKGLGADTLGYQVNLPFSIELEEKWVMHWNLGATFAPDSKVAEVGSANNTSFNFGSSLVYLASPTFNLMLEVVGSSDEVTIGDSATEREDSFFISPGVRYAMNFDSGLQIVPGAAVPVGIGPSEGEYGVIGYLSFEHPF